MAYLDRQIERERMVNFTEFPLHHLKMEDTR
jgi:hypothetical protein